LILPSLLHSQATKFKGPGQPPTKVVEKSDDKKSQFLDQLDIRFDRKYSDLITRSGLLSIVSIYFMHGDSFAQSLVIHLVRSGYFVYRK